MFRWIVSLFARLIRRKPVAVKQDSEVKALASGSTPEPEAVPDPDPTPKTLSKDVPLPSDRCYVIKSDDAPQVLYKCRHYGDEDPTFNLFGDEFSLTDDVRNERELCPDCMLR